MYVVLILVSCTSTAVLQVTCTCICMASLILQWDGVYMNINVWTDGWTDGWISEPVPVLHVVPGSTNPRSSESAVVHVHVRAMR